jgi:ABC-type antimicrobial peptide transport system permease subunit
VLWVVAIVVFFATGTTMTLSLYERLREFGTCLSLGAPRLRLVGGILLEALLAGIVGLILGGGAAALAARLINASGGIYMAAAPGMATDLHINILFSSQACLLSLLTALVVPPLAVILPARKILSKTIVVLLNKGQS